ncbi:MAG TPA: hypothetical protein VN673_04625, partial [Clostridia bacterium]|nr:hypothetical protein [Clostridia bacterium]
MKNRVGSNHDQGCGTLRQPARPLKASWTRMLFPIMSALALGWFLVRVIPKPIRATYPCQRAAFPLASAFVIWLLAIKSGVVAWLGFAGTSRWRPLLLFTGGVGLAATTIATVNQAVSLISPGPQPVWVRTDPANTPIGTARGIYAGRVVWMRDTNATPWNGATGHWWDSGSGTDQDAVERMMASSLLALTGATNETKAWDRLFRFYNNTHNRGDVGYASTESIAIKLNCNNCYTGYGDVDNQIDASPQSVLALLRQLVNKAGVPQDRIVVYEAIRVVPNRVYDPCHAEFPNVIWVDSQGNGTNGRQPVNWHSGAFSYSATCTSGTSIPELVYQATYLINMAM